MKLKHILASVLAVSALMSCQKAEEPFMTLSQKTLNVPEEGGSYDVVIDANVYYRINNDMEWTTVELGETVGTKTTLHLTVQANPETKSRSKRVRFIGDNVTPLYVEVNQAAKVPVGVSVETINVKYNVTSASFTVLGSKEWTASCDRPEFQLSKTSGTGEELITVTFPANSSQEPVTATVSVKIGADSYSVKIIQAGAPKNEVVDLSEKGTSNCYLVTDSGKYKFSATKAGNGVVPASQSGMSADIAPASVKVLWSSVGTKDAPASDEVVIKNVTLESGAVKFEVPDPFVEGNVVIAALDASSNIVWSWHIWATEASQDIAVGSTFWMDRNLGALSPSSYKTHDALACGLHYQWGRKDPFRGAWTFDDTEMVMEIGTTGTWPSPVLVDETHSGIAYTIANPQQIIHVSGSSHNNKDWHWNAQYNDLWGGGDDANAHGKTMFDPCPAGYHVPSSQMHKDLAAEFGITKADISTADYGIGKESFWLVYPGGPLYNTGVLAGPVGGYSWYATCTTSGVNMLCTRSHTTACNFGGATSARTAGYSVRCVKE